MTLQADRSSDVRVDWRVASGAAAALVLLFTFQNYLTPRVTRGNSSLALTFVLQLITWSAWFMLCPLIILRDGTRPQSGRTYRRRVQDLLR